MGWFTRCPVCAVERLAVFKVCWNCGTPEGTEMACNPCTEQPCPHCDMEAFDPRSCPHCASIHYSTQHSRVQLNTTPWPDSLTEAAIHDGIPIGAIGRCTACGGRTYLTDTGEWCPRAFCQPNVQEPAG